MKVEDECKLGSFMVISFNRSATSGQICIILFKLLIADYLNYSFDLLRRLVCGAYICSVICVRIDQDCLPLLLGNILALSPDF